MKYCTRWRLIFMAWLAALLVAHLAVVLGLGRTLPNELVIAWLAATAVAFVGAWAVCLPRAAWYDESCCPYCRYPKTGSGTCPECGRATE